tara:strand:- start:202 stop:453 length:252 start_codon:yes stop_codon:yes gene_type:complete
LDRVYLADHTGYIVTPDKDDDIHAYLEHVEEARKKHRAHLVKWFCCHPCYLAQMLRASKIILDAKNGTLSSISGAPAEAEMAR